MKVKRNTSIMKRVLLYLFITLLLPVALHAQEEITKTKKDFKPNGRAFGKVFFNYNYNFTEGTTQPHSFALQRAYLGYKYNFS